MKGKGFFNFTSKGIKSAMGYVIGEITTTDYGCDFLPEKVVVTKYIGKKPDFELLERLAIENCVVIR